MSKFIQKIFKDYIQGVFLKMKSFKHKMETKLCTNMIDIYDLKDQIFIWTPFRTPILGVDGLPKKDSLTVWDPKWFGRHHNMDFETVLSLMGKIFHFI